MSLDGERSDEGTSELTRIRLTAREADAHQQSSRFSTASTHAENEGVNELLRHFCPFVLQRQSKFPESLLVVNTRPHSLSLQFRCSRQHRERLLRWAGVKGTHRTGRHANRPPPCSLLATVKRDIGRPVACAVCLAISPAVCRLFLLASILLIVWALKAVGPLECSLPGCASQAQKAVLPHWRLSVVPRRPDKLDFTRFSGYKMYRPVLAACRPGIGTGQADEALDTEY
ncbi:uncharacterized protein TNCV_1032221 [Trichonephila clavipes]|nr:uncharacterized protein TNCV_1032221 [Trichonephila clavipes]